jgi:hypothetical protein
VAAPSDIDADIDDLFQLPLTEFTAARNALSAWAVNQPYWRHR